MKYKGKKIEGRNSDILVLMKGGERIVFKAEAVPDYKDFDKFLPTPEPPSVLRPGGQKVKDENDPTFKERLAKYAEQKTNYLILKSLEVSDDVEWETVDIEKPETWKNWRTELADAGFSEVEVIRVMQLCMQVNALDQDMLDEAKQTFLQEVSLQNQ